MDLSIFVKAISEDQAKQEPNLYTIVYQEMLSTSLTTWQTSDWNLFMQKYINIYMSKLPIKLILIKGKGLKDD